jgi:hypothetical protein
MALPPLELFSLKGKAALLPGGFFVYLRDLRPLKPQEFASKKYVTAFNELGHSRRARSLYEPSQQRYNQQATHHSATPSKADVAQLVEQPIRNRQVSGSSPLVGSSSFATGSYSFASLIICCIFSKECRV